MKIVLHVKNTQQREKLLSRCELIILTGFANIEEKEVLCATKMRHGFFKNISSAKVWKDIVDIPTNSRFMVPFGRVERSKLAHIGCAEPGILNEPMILFRGSKSNKSTGCHSEMDRNVFSYWCKTKIFPKIAGTRKSSVVVLSRAIYHIV